VRLRDARATVVRTSSALMRWRRPTRNSCQ
jgi:hypothetical protein